MPHERPPHWRDGVARACTTMPHMHRRRPCLFAVITVVYLTGAIHVRMQGVVHSHATGGAAAAIGRCGRYHAGPRVCECWHCRIAGNRTGSTVMAACATYCAFSAFCMLPHFAMMHCPVPPGCGFLVMGHSPIIVSRKSVWGAWTTAMRQLPQHQDWSPSSYGTTSPTPS